MEFKVVWACQAKSFDCRINRNIMEFKVYHLGICLLPLLRINRNIMEFKARQTGCSTDPD